MKLCKLDYGEQVIVAGKDSEISSKMPPPLLFQPILDNPLSPCYIPTTIPAEIHLKPVDMQRHLSITRIGFAFLTTILPFILVGRVCGQSSDIRFDHISVEQGLSQDIVTSIVQDRQGFMWFGTQDGLNRYDGYSIKIFKHDPRDPTSIFSNVIGPIYEDQNGVLWIAAGGGLDQYDADRNIFVHHRHDEMDPHSLSHNHVTSICEDGDGNLWVGTGNGLNRLDPNKKQFVRYRHHLRDQNSISSDYIGVLHRDRSNTLWVGTDNGLNVYDSKNDRFVRYFYNEKPRYLISSLADDGKGNLWIGYAGYGVKRFSRSTGRITHYRPLIHNPASLGDVIVFDICVDGRGTVWMATFSSLDKYDPVSDSFIHYRHNPNNPHSLSSDRPGALFEDKAGVLWVGTWHGGVSRYDPFKQKFALFRNIPNDLKSLSSNEVLAILEDRAGNMWVGTSGGGLNHYNQTTKQFVHYRHQPANPNSISSNIVTALWEDRKGNLWVGCDGGTLDRFDRKHRMFVHYPFGDIKTIFEDSQGELWLGLASESRRLQESLIRFNPNKNTSTVYRNVPSHPDSLHGEEVWCIYEDRSGDLWIATWKDGAMLNRFQRREGRFTHYEHDPEDVHSISGNSVRAIQQDRQGFLWFGTWGAGLNKFDPTTGRFTRFHEHDGLPNNYIKGILVDDRENLWISTEMGLSKFNPQTGAFKNFSTDDGLQAERFLSGSCFKGRSGKLYFGGENGYNVFHPDSIQDNPNVPPIVITNFKVFDEPVQLPQSTSVNKEISLKYEEDVFSFEFVALDYTAPRRNQYAYMMEGFDKDWVNAGTRRYASYTHLDPGEYIFRVKGSNNDGVWNEQGASVNIVIQPAYWQTWWFRAFVVFVVAGIFYGFYRYRIANLLRVERLRSRIAADLHDDVGSNLSSIALASQLIARKISLPDNEMNQLTEIGSTALRTSDMMKEIVWLLNPRNDSVDDLLLKMKAVAETMLRGTTYEFVGPHEKLTEKIDLEMKRNLYMMYKEILNNIVKHASATAVSIHIAWENGKLLLTVQDDGKGFDATKPSTGNGLQNLRRRSEQIGAHLTISSRSGGGVVVSLGAEIT